MMLHAVGQPMAMARPVKSQTNPAIRPLPARPSAVDTVQFKGKTDLLAKYGIDPDQIPVVPADAKLVVDKRVMLEKILAAHEQARKNQLLGNLSDRYFSSNILLENGTWGVGTNIEMSRTRVFCGERSAVVDAWNQALQKTPLSRLEKADVAGRQRIQDQLKIKLLTFSEANKPDTDWTACAECLSWMGTTRYFAPDTQIAHLWRNPDTGELALRVGSIRGHLPLANRNQRSLTSQPIASLQDIQFSPKAQAVVDTLKGQPAELSPDRLRDMLAVAKQAYEINRTADLSGEHLGAAVLLDNGQIVSGQRFDWTKRWHLPADLMAAACAIQQNTSDNGQPRIVAMAYYGDDPAVPSELSLGPVSQGRGDGDTLIVQIEDEDTIHVRTLRDHMPFVYISSKVSRKA